MKEMKYAEAVAELETLVAGMEDPGRDFTGMAGDVKRAMELIKWCRAYIRGQETEIERIMKEDES